MKKYKLCGGCKKKLLTSNFWKSKQKKDGLLDWCKECRGTYLAEYYQKNKKKLQEKNRKVRIVLRRKRTLLVLKYLQTHPCVDCGETDPVCLDFDHVKGQKINDISGMISDTYSEKNILKEVEKCEVRCSNCHRKKTAKERDWYNYIDFNTMTIIE